MRVAVPVWQGRVSPVFDVAGQLLLVELVKGAETCRSEHRLRDAEPEQRAAQLCELKVETLICGAISQALEALLTENGIRVHGRVCGNVDDVLRAFATGTLGQTRFVMPGCCGQARRRFRGACGRGRRSQEGGLK
jgi:predicted Fe-Mo cluster-binding NifX family protein